LHDWKPKGRISTAEESNRLKEEELDVLRDRGFSESEMAMVSELAGAMQEEGMSSPEAFNEAWRRVAAMRSGEAPAAPSSGRPAAASPADDPIEALKRLEATASRPTSELSRTFKVLGIADDPTALDISERLLSRSRKSGDPVTEDSLDAIRQYMLDKRSVDPEFMDLGSPLFAPSIASRHESYAMAEMLADPSVPLAEVLDMDKVRERAKRRAEAASKSIKRPGWRDVVR